MIEVVIETRLEIRCDGLDRTHGDKTMRYPHGKTGVFSYPWEHKLSTKIKRARADGWRVSMHGRSLCPECKRKEGYGRR